jgi:hypothetical protein
MHGRISETEWTPEKRAAYFKSHPENFAGEGDSFPIEDAEDVTHAAQRHGSGSLSADTIKRRIKTIAHRLGLAHALPEDWNEEEAT